MRSCVLSLFVLTLALLSAAHQPPPQTAEEKEALRSLHAAAYHCAPAVAEFTAARQRSWAQKVLGGRPTLSDQDELFGPGTYADLAPDGKKEQIMGCTPVEETRIRNNTCVLAPEVTEGPYYHTVGHPMRQNIIELQFGLLLLLDIGVIDVETCKPLPNVLVDIWQTNATGHYAGHPVPKPHLVYEKPQVGGSRAGLLTAYPRTVDEETWLRGAWPTDENGVAHFTTIFPGYYTGRATHIHTKVIPEWEVLPNGTFVSHRLAHVGQFFFDDDVNIQVDKMWPYMLNPIKDTNGRTRNWRDSLNIFDNSHIGGYNPVIHLEKLGVQINQGFIGYITMGINASASYDNWWKG